ncbi:MAG: LysR family transcriptional regulator [Synergistes sp.]|nr:LysR family transcriptional regulator [Synergistes sp.]
MALIDKNPIYFITIVQERSISKAATKLFVSQSYLSRYLQKLEEALGVQLFDRSKNPIAVTNEGKKYYQYLENKNKLYTEFIAELDDMNRHRVNSLNLGLTPWRSATLLPDILPSFVKRFDNVNVYLHEYAVRELYTKLETNTVDVCVVNAQNDSLGKFQMEAIANENIVLVANKNNPMTEKLREYRSSGKMVPYDLNCLDSECFILLEEGTYCGEYENNYINNNRYLFKRLIRTKNRYTAINLVNANLGFCFVLETGIHNISTRNLEFFNLHSPELIAPLFAVYKKDVSLSVAARRFIDMTKEYYSVLLPQRRENLIS